MKRKKLLQKAKVQADQWYYIHKLLIEARQYIERMIIINEKEQLCTLRNQDNPNRLKI